MIMRHNAHIFKRCMRHLVGNRMWSGEPKVRPEFVFDVLIRNMRSEAWQRALKLTGHYLTNGGRKPPVRGGRCYLGMSLKRRLRNSPTLKVLVELTSRYKPLHSFWWVWLNCSKMLSEIPLKRWRSFASYAMWVSTRRQRRSTSCM